MKALCNSKFAGSHVCTAKEITNSYEYDASGAIAAATGNSWINNGPPAYITDVSNDCNGWTTNEPSPSTETYFGSTWKFSTKNAMMSHCSRQLTVACCSY